MEIKCHFHKSTPSIPTQGQGKITALSEARIKPHIIKLEYSRNKVKTHDKNITKGLIKSQTKLKQAKMH